MLRPIADVDDAAGFEVAIADVEISVNVIEPHAAPPEFAAVERVVVVVELQERDAPLAVLEQAVLERGLGERLAACRMLFQHGRIGERAKRQMPVGDFRLKSGDRFVVESDRRFAAAIQLQADEPRVGDAVQHEHPPARGAVPDELRIASVTDHEPADPPCAAGVPYGDRLGEPIRSRRKIQDGTVAHAAERFLNGGRIVRLAIADGSRFDIRFDIDPVGALLPRQRRDLRRRGERDGRDDRDGEQSQQPANVLPEVDHELLVLAKHGTVNPQPAALAREARG